MYRSITLPNGAKLLTEFVPGARTAALGFFVGTGSRHERAAETVSYTHLTLPTIRLV